MTNSLFKTLSGSTALCLLIAGSASAEVTALEVWDNWKTYSESFGQTVTVGSQTTSGDTLMLKDVGISMDFPEGSMTGSIGFLELRERGDGTVAITMAPEYPFSITVDPEEGDSLDMDILISQTGMTMVASGSADDISYDYLAALMNITVGKIIVDGKEFESDISLSINDLDGQYAIKSGDIKQISETVNAASVVFNFDFTDPEDGASMKISGNYADIASSFSGSIPADLDLEDPSWVLGNELGGGGELSTGKTDFSMALEDGSDSFAIQGGSESSTLHFSMEDGTIGYGGTATETSYSLSGAQIPLPSVSLSLQETAFNLVFPFGQSSDPQDFAFLTKLVGLSIPDDIWGMLDPAQTLPRDPATFVIDIVGSMNWLVNLVDEEEMAMVEEEGKMPAELHSLSLNELTLALAGAEVSGTGDFTFDNTDLATFGGMPAPTGAIDIKIVGINGLIDNLISMGLLPEEQAMGGRMMLGLFARPADGPDTMTSKIEVKGDGSVYANGQQLK